MVDHFHFGFFRAFVGAAAVVAGFTVSPPCGMCIGLAFLILGMVLKKTLRGGVRCAVVTVCCGKVPVFPRILALGFFTAVWGTEAFICQKKADAGARP